MEEIQEKSLTHESTPEVVDTTPTPYVSLDENLRLAIEGIAEKKGFDIVALDLREIASFTEFFVIASGANQRQVQAMADEINDQMKQKSHSRAIRIEGYAKGEWVLLDFGDFVVHLFDKDSREFYDLARLWHDARRVELPTTL